MNFEQAPTLEGLKVGDEVLVIQQRSMPRSAIVTAIGRKLISVSGERFKFNRDGGNNGQYMDPRLSTPEIQAFYARVAEAVAFLKERDIEVNWRWGRSGWTSPGGRIALAELIRAAEAAAESEEN